MRIRFGHFNVRDLTAGKLRDPEHPQVLSASAIIRKVRPHVLSINEIEGLPEAPRLFLDNFLQRGDSPLRYPYQYAGATNSGVCSGLPPPFDFKGFGLFEGQYGIALFSRFPILREGIRSFEHFPWRALPGGLSSLGHRAVDVPEGFPLFSTNLLDVPLRMGGRVVHAILLHASVPVRGPFNKERNADQLNFLNEYISRRALSGAEPFKAENPFVVMGDLNADPEKGEGIKEAVGGLLANPALHGGMPPGPTFLEGGGVEAPPMDREGFSLRLDYILPSRDFVVLRQGVFGSGEAGWWNQVRLASDHFFVYADCLLA
ncbi:MAG: endonuclease/exonuclease/phosphatase family protein [Nitrospiraceae bacterium]|nr:MAG: endonuclease/exonuclease/phosphatase family protein [Nitrospiraceae bacterium]